MASLLGLQKTEQRHHPGQVPLPNIADFTSLIAGSTVFSRLVLSGRIGPLNSTMTLSKTTSSYLIVGVRLVVVRKHCQPIADQSLDSGHHAVCNPILADLGVQT